MSDQYGYEVIPVNLVEAENTVGQQCISSTLIRQYISVGDVSVARKYLGRPHEITGIVVHGDHKGRELGYPTANMQVDSNIAIPSDGVYAGSVIVKGELYNQDIYFEPISVIFQEKLRDQLVFSSITDLISQIDLDCDKTRQIVKI